MGQCVSSSGDSTTDTNASQAESCCQAPVCQKTCGPPSRSRYCAQHAMCKRQGCTRPRFQRGPYCQEHLYTCRVSKCLNNQARVLDAWFTNNLCLQHQPEDVLRVYFYGEAAEPEPVYGMQVDGHQQRARRRRSRQKSKTIPVPVPQPRDNSDEHVSESEDDEKNSAATGYRLSMMLSTIEEEGDGVYSLRPSVMKLAEDQTYDMPATPRRSQKTVHFADSPPRPSSPEKSPVEAESWLTESANQFSSPRLRNSRHRRSLDGRHQPPRTSSSAVMASGHRHETRCQVGSSNSSSSTPQKTANVKRATRTRPNR